ncbi:type II toxin-antitoxin system antitoxin, TscA family [Staphylococcus caeli]|uniref:TscA family type II toxin-antitoxin system antitoxin n=1 Tax=Staphylococcus caeli TaxID=2201815 RepID=UPI003F55EF3F
MKIKQKYQLSKIVKVLEKVLDEKDKEVFLSAKDRFHSITYYRYNDTAFYEHILKLVHKELFNIVSCLKLNTEEYEIINEVVNTLHDVMNEKQETYSYSVIDEKGTSDYTTDREGHIVGILEWTIDYIVGNIEVEETE